MLTLADLKSLNLDEYPEYSKFSWQEDIQDGVTGLDYWNWVLDALNNQEIIDENRRMQNDFKKKYG